MSDSKKPDLAQRLCDEITAENIQKYVLGFKKNGQPRSVYDVFKPKKKKKKKSKGSSPNPYMMYLGIKKKKNKKKKNKHWKI